MKYICIGLGIILVLETICLIWMKDSLKKKRDIGATVQFFRDLWGKFVFYVLATSIIGLFLGSIFFKKVIGLDEMNNWVSIILGLVALIIGVISLYLSFYNLDESVKAQDKNLALMNGVKTDIENRLLSIDDSIQLGFEKLHKDFYLYVGNDKKNTKVVTSKRDADEQDWRE